MENIETVNTLEITTNIAESTLVVLSNSIIWSPLLVFGS